MKILVLAAAALALASCGHEKTDDTQAPCSDDPSFNLPACSGDVVGGRPVQDPPAGTQVP